MVATKAFTFPRSHFIGFDYIWSEIERLSEMADNKLYPPHNVVLYPDQEQITIELALAGYKADELTVEVREGLLVVSGEKPLSDGREYSHRGISSKRFSRTFRLSEHVVVSGANFVDGLLVIDLKVELPEEKRPRKIEIGNQPQLLTEG